MSIYVSTTLEELLMRGWLPGLATQRHISKKNCRASGRLDKTGVDIAWELYYSVGGGHIPLKGNVLCEVNTY